MSRFKTPYTRHENTPIFFEGKSRAHQSFKDECNINTIMAKYQDTGYLPHLNTGTPQYGDFSTVHDFQSSLNAVLAAQDAFQSLPSSLRKRFGNDPAEFLAFVEDPSNRDEAVKLGLIRKPDPDPMPEAPMARQEVPPAAAPTNQPAAQPQGLSSAEQRPEGA